ncbi:hypothetical protein WICMUC_003977 [Wickerhamomyces mucosus]|uniref:Protein disulfide-isomerase n=1 Tax=Wickerhamomyces mucosus TaxID=1378264 RepID=A0A9P8PIM5_9ASCO|nr:hypothetical protein WICMUC_003977 [Wickerhamomyces mucosus]
MKFFSALNFKTISTLLACVSIAQAAGDKEAIADPNSAVVKLTSSTFSKFLDENPLVLAEFFAPWCGHCKALGPEFAQAADELESKDIKLAQIDCTEEEELCQEYGIRGYPTLKVFKGRDVLDYEGTRKSDGIVSYMIKQSLPPVSLIDDFEELLTYIEDQPVPVIVETGVKLNETFYQLSDANRDDFVFVQTKSAELKKKYGEDKILIFSKEFEEPLIYSDEDESYETLQQWVKAESLPYFGELDGSTYQKYSTANIPLAYLFYTSEEEREAWKDTVVELAKESRGKINFVGIDSTKFGRHAENLNMQQEFPLFVIHDVVTNKKYGFPQKEVLNQKEVAAFVKRYSVGEIDPIVKTEEIPEIQENFVYKIVGKTHNDIINDEEKDVLVKYYAPWCGHCKRLAPVYEELAELYASSKEGKSKIRIANVDATLNDVEVDIAGYPTLILYPAGDKSNPIVHKGGRDLQSLVNFIKESGSFELDGNALEDDVESIDEVEEPVTDDDSIKESKENTHDEL